MVTLPDAKASKGTAQPTCVRDMEGPCACLWLLPEMTGDPRSGMQNKDGLVPVLEVVECAQGQACAETGQDAQWVPSLCPHTAQMVMAKSSSSCCVLK